METGKEGGEVKMYLRNLKGGITEQQKFDRKRKNNGEVGSISVSGQLPTYPSPNSTRVN